MKIDVSRRDVLKFAAGGAVGAMLTPVPWKTLDDVAIWSQNWSWIPRPPKGPSSMKATTCALCPAGCAVEARLIGTLPVSMRAKCALGLTAHHLPYHPQRITRPLRLFMDGRRRVPVTLDAALEAARRAMRNGSVAVLDMRPGRSPQIPGMTYVAAPSIYTDAGDAETVISFRAPAPAGRRVISVDPCEQPERWLPARPGTEAALAYGLAHLLKPGQSTAFTPSSVAAATGVGEASIVATARELASSRSIAIAEYGLGTTADAAVAALNEALGHPPSVIQPNPVTGVNLLIVDMSAGDVRFPWSTVRRMLAPNALVVALSPYAAGTALHADYVIPTPAFLEGDILPLREGAVDPQELIKSLSAGLGTPPPSSPAPAPRVSAAGLPVVPGPGLTLVVRTPRDVSSTAVVSPVMTKLYQESSLRRGLNVAVMNPKTARELQVREKAKLQLAGGSLRVTVAQDDAVMPNVVEMSVAPDAKWTSAAPVLELIEPCADGGWRSVPVRVVEA